MAKEEVVIVRGDALQISIRMANGELAIVRGIPFRFPSEWPRSGRTKTDSLLIAFTMASGEADIVRRYPLQILVRTTQGWPH